MMKPFFQFRTFSKDECKYCYIFGNNSRVCKLFRPKNSGHCVKRLRRFRAHTTAAAAAANDLQVSFGEEAKNFTPNHEGHGRDQTFSQASLMPSYVHISVYY